jgi:hypothetical protein
MSIKPIKINEATSVGSSGNFRNPLILGLKYWEKKELGPFVKKVSKFDNPELAYDSYDGKLSVSKKKAKSMEKKSEKIAKYLKNHPISNDDDGDNINGGNGPKVKTKRINEDLGVWFGTKKKPKGSSQPKGPWVNICRKKEGGGHPPCGRSEASPGSYPKCRAAGVASKMTDAQKKSACQQKRRVEKSNPKIGTGNKPTMASYKPKKKTTKEDFILETIIKKCLRSMFR